VCSNEFLYLIVVNEEYIISKTTNMAGVKGEGEQTCRDVYIRCWDRTSTSQPCGLGEEAVHQAEYGGQSDEGWKHYIERIGAARGICENPQSLDEQIQRAKSIRPLRP
jgi:hypothetical protein